MPTTRHRFAALAAFILSLPAWGQVIRVTSPLVVASMAMMLPMRIERSSRIMEPAT